MLSFERREAATAHNASSPRSPPGYELRKWLRSRSKARQSPAQNGPHGATTSGLLSLPVELQFMITSHLDLAETVALRRVCRLYRHVITADIVQAQFSRYGQYDAILQGCCSECLTTPGLDRLILDVTREHDAWRSICFRCWRTQLTPDYQRKHGPLLELANGEYGYICHFCAWPVCGGDGQEGSQELLHAPCRVKRYLATITWFVMAILQVGLGVLALVLAVTQYRKVPTVLIPTCIDFGLSIVALALFIIRTCAHDEQKYTYALAAELMMTVVRIPPVCYTARETVNTPNVTFMSKFALGIFLLNLVFRFVDTVGYTLLYFGYDPRSMFIAGLSLRKKMVYMLCTFVVWCAFIPN
ncbi:hypothetical protein JX265_011680 [Neoarthrinium moseri]|uniref:F-box domain-containing protein n=1 Tax=Neoarthrinium moseri TaxID=1658444 RepID=A0A9Q0AJB3_9PEZI|nr:hypothetical protein JX266_008428 [Neoarthrinium moseri]KAI1856433.1 hypothetical protein JX265_011680 [Neoarthrinium moseri]